MVAACREGWRAYLDDPTPANAEHGRAEPDMDPATFAEAAEAQKPLIETDETKKPGLGAMTGERWTVLGKQLVDLGVLNMRRRRTSALSMWRRCIRTRCDVRRVVFHRGTAPCRCSSFRERMGEVARATNLLDPR